MSLYNLIFGVNPIADFLLGILNLTREDMGRFRDAFVSENEIAVYTRNGGGNRDDYADVFGVLSLHPNYLRDEDDDFDCTYATIYFSIPEDWKIILKAMDDGTFNPDDRWNKAIEDLKAGNRQDVVKKMAPIVDFITKALGDTKWKAVRNVTTREIKRYPIL